MPNNETEYTPMNIETVLSLLERPPMADVKVYVSSMVLVNEVLMKIEARQGLSRQPQGVSPFTSYNIVHSEHLPPNSYVAMQGFEIIATGNLLSEDDYDAFKKSH